MSQGWKETVLVTGGAGFIGSHLVDRLVREEYNVVIVDNLSTGQKEYINPQAKLVRLDIASDDKKLRKVFTTHKPKVVFHLAANKDLRDSVEHPMRDAQMNVVGTLNVLEAARAVMVDRVVFASTAAVYSSEATLPISERSFIRPESPYGISKRAAEMYMWHFSELYPMACVSLRFSNVYGPRAGVKEAGVVGIFAERMLRGEQIVINGTGEQTRDFLYVGDAVDGFVRAMRVAWCGEMNMATNSEVSVNEMFEQLQEITGYKREPEYLEARNGELFQNRLDASLASQVMGWSPQTPFNEGLRKTVEWYKKQPR